MTQSKKIRVLVVDDSEVMRQKLSEIINSDSECEVIATAKDGEEAVKSVAQLKPDVITLELELPKMDGMTALKYIMSEWPTPVVVVTAFTEFGGENVMKCMEYWNECLECGAVDLVIKPDGPVSTNIETKKEELILKIKAANAVKQELLRPLVLGKQSGTKNNRPAAVKRNRPGVEKSAEPVSAENNKPTAPKTNNVVETPGEIFAKAEKQVRKPMRRISPENAGKADVFEIISDLEKQLDAAFSFKDAQEKGILDLKESLQIAEEKVKVLEEELASAADRLVAQSKLELELGSLENDRFEMLSEKRSLKREIEASAAIRKDLEGQIAHLAKEGEAWNGRIAQMEQEISSANAMIQNLRQRVFDLEDEKDVFSNKSEAMEAELAGAVAERDRYKKEFTQAKESLDEIRLTLVDTRTRTRGRYYKDRPK